MSVLPDTGLAAYNTLVTMRLPEASLVALIVGLHAAAEQPPPAKKVVRQMVGLGPIRSWKQLRAIDGFGRRRQANLRQILGSSSFSKTLSTLLAALNDVPAPVPPPDVDFGMSDEEFASLMGLAQPFSSSRRSHPLGEGVTFPPQVARMLRRPHAQIQGDPRPLYGFPFSDRVLGFRDALRRPTPKQALIVGAGYIGAEVGLHWATRGAQVTILDNGPVVLRGYTPEHAAAVQAMLEDAGVMFRFNVTATGWTEQDGKVVVTAHTDEASLTFSADLVMVAVGVQVKAVYWAT
ncbi:MAG: FAD-dependent oxidoreductase [Myxococcota bacterium]